MSGLRIGAILLIIAGTLGLAAGQFSYHMDTRGARLGPMGVSVSERKTVTIPVWASVGAIVAGSLVLLARRKRPRR